MRNHRTFETGASRDLDSDKLDFEGCLSPSALIRYAEYMKFKETMGDGTTRTSDNWQKGFPPEAYIKSLLRHTFDVWAWHRGAPTREDLETALCAIIFNAQGLLHETLKPTMPE